MILETIRRVYPELTRSQQLLSDFVAHSYREAAFMTASDLAQRLNLNEATVIRFAQRLGYSGYPELVTALRELVQQELIVAPGDTDVSQDSDLELLAAELGNARRMVRSLSPGRSSRLHSYCPAPDTSACSGRACRGRWRFYFVTCCAPLGFTPTNIRWTHNPWRQHCMTLTLGM